MRLLVTRPEADAERTAAVLRSRGHDVTVAPLLRIEPVANADIGDGPWAAILVTSANATAAVRAQKRFAELKNVPVLAVGERTAQAMREAGFASVISGAGGASELMRIAAERLKGGVPLLYLAGADRSGDIAGDLTAQNFIVHTAVVYRAVATDILPRAATDALTEGVDGVLHFSRRSAEAYIRSAAKAGLSGVAVKRPVHFCLSARVAEPLAEAGAGNIRIAPQSDEAALVALIPAG